MAKSGEGTIVKIFHLLSDNKNTMVGRKKNSYPRKPVSCYMNVYVVPSGSRNNSKALPTRGSGAGGPGMLLQWSMKARRLLKKTQMAVAVKKTAIQTVSAEGIHRSTFSRCSSIILSCCCLFFHQPHSLLLN